MSLGLGPTPQDVGTPGTQRKIPTRFQMEMLARQQTEQQVVALTQRMDHMQQQMDEMKKLFLASQGLQNVEATSQHGSNSRPMNIMFEQAHDDEEQHGHQGIAEHASMETIFDRQEEDMVYRRIVSPNVAPRNIAATARNREASHNEDDSAVGRDVILYALVRDIPVAKATITSTDPNTVVGDQRLGREYYEVVMTVPFKRDVLLPRPYDGIENIGDAHKLSVAWPHKRIKDSKKQAASQTAGRITKTS